MLPENSTEAITIDHIRQLCPKSIALKTRKSCARGQTDAQGGNATYWLRLERDQLKLVNNEIAKPDTFLAKRYYFLRENSHFHFAFHLNFATSSATQQDI